MRLYTSMVLFLLSSFPCTLYYNISSL